MSFLYNSSLFVLTLSIFFISSCNCDDDGMPGEPFADCEWMVTLEPVVVDSCFTPGNTPWGSEIIPPYTEPYLYQIIPGENEDGIFFYLLRGGGDLGPFDLYRLDLCNVETTFLTSIPSYSNSNIRLNGKNQLIYMANFETHLYNIDDDVFSTPLPGLEIEEVRWLNDSLIISNQVIETSQGFTSRWIINNLYTTEALDTLELLNGEVSSLRNNVVALNATPPASGTRSVYLYDLAEEEIINSYQLEEPFDRGVFIEYLSDTELILEDTPHFVARFNLETEEVELLLDTSDCPNIKYNSVITLPNNTEEIMYIRTEYFYDENDNYLRKHELVRYNINTQVEEVIVF